MNQSPSVHETLKRIFEMAVSEKKGVDIREIIDVYVKNVRTVLPTFRNDLTFTADAQQFDGNDEAAILLLLRFG